MKLAREPRRPPRVGLSVLDTTNFGVVLTGSSFPVPTKFGVLQVGAATDRVADDSRVPMQSSSSRSR